MSEHEDRAHEEEDDTQGHLAHSDNANETVEQDEQPLEDGAADGD